MLQWLQYWIAGFYYRFYCVKNTALGTSGRLMLNVQASALLDLVCSAFLSGRSHAAKCHLVADAFKLMLGCFLQEVEVFSRYVPS